MAENKSRFKNILLTSNVNFVFYLILLVITFFSRKIFLKHLGLEFMGLASTLQSVLGYLNLAELGVGVATSYLLYKPLFDNDRNTVKEIMSVFSLIYFRIGSFVLITGSVLALFLPLFFKQSGIPGSLIILTFFVFLLSSAIDYFFNFQQLLFHADQKSYKLTICFQSVLLVKLLVQTGLIKATGNPYIWVLIEIISAIISCCLFQYLVRKEYPWLSISRKFGKEKLKDYSVIFEKMKQILVHSIGSLVQYQSSPIIISSLVNLSTVALYGNYQLLMSKATQIVNIAFMGVQAGIGNVIAEKNTEKLLNIFWEIMTIRHYLAGVLITVMYYCLTPFIQVWLGDSYLLSPIIVILLLVSTYIDLTSTMLAIFLRAIGLFHDTKIPICESAVFLCVAIGAGYYYGIAGIILGGIVSKTLFGVIWKPYFLFHHGLKVTVKKYWIMYGKIMFLSILSFAATFFLFRYIKFPVQNLNFISFCMNSILIGLIVVAVFSLIFFVGNRSMRLVIRRFSSYFLKKIQIKSS